MSRRRKRYCARCQTRLRRKSVRCPYCGRYSLSRPRLFIVAGGSLICLSLLLRLAGAF